MSSDPSKELSFNEDELHEIDETRRHRTSASRPGRRRRKTLPRISLGGAAQVDEGVAQINRTRSGTLPLGTVVDEAEEIENSQQADRADAEAEKNGSGDGKHIGSPTPPTDADVDRPPDVDTEDNEPTVVESRIDVSPPDREEGAADLPGDDELGDVADQLPGDDAQLGDAAAASLDLAQAAGQSISADGTEGESRDNRVAILLSALKPAPGLPPLKAPADDRKTPAAAPRRSRSRTDAVRAEARRKVEQTVAERVARRREVVAPSPEALEGGQSLALTAAQDAQPCEVADHAEGSVIPAANIARPPPLPADTATGPPTPPEPPPVEALDSAPAEGARTDQPKVAPPWFERIFDEEYLRLEGDVDRQIILREVDFIEHMLQPAASSELLDLGSGDGRHAIELAARGYRVTGVDRSGPLLADAAVRARKRTVDVEWLSLDFRALDFDRAFDAVYCYNTSFGYFDDEANRQMIMAVHAALRSEGRFLLHVLNRDHAIRLLPKRVWWEATGCVVLEEVDFNYFTSRLLSKRSVVFEDGRHVEQDISVRCYSLHELGKILHHCGFRVLEVSGHIAHRGRFFGADSRSILILAEKRPAR